MDSGQLTRHGHHQGWLERGPDDASEPLGEAVHTLEHLSFPRSRQHLWDRSPLAPAKSVAGLVQDVALSVHQSIGASLRDLAMHVVPAVMASVSVQYMPEEGRLALQLCSPHHPMGVVDGMMTIRTDDSDGNGNSVRHRQQRIHDHTRWSWSFVTIGHGHIRRRAHSRGVGPRGGLELRAPSSDLHGHVESSF
jgi:hypothetical protein